MSGKFRPVLLKLFFIFRSVYLLRTGCLPAQVNSHRVGAEVVVPLGGKKDLQLAAIIAKPEDEELGMDAVLLARPISKEERDLVRESLRNKSMTLNRFRLRLTSIGISSQDEAVLDRSLSSEITNSKHKDHAPPNIRMIFPNQTWRTAEGMQPIAVVFPYQLGDVKPRFVVEGVDGLADIKAIKAKLAAVPHSELLNQFTMKLTPPDLSPEDIDAINDAGGEVKLQVYRGEDESVGFPVLFHRSPPFVGFQAQQVGMMSGKNKNNFGYYDALTKPDYGF